MHNKKKTFNKTGTTSTGLRVKGEVQILFRPPEIIF